MSKLKVIANEIKTVEAFQDFCIEYISSEWQSVMTLIPLISDNLSNEIDIKNDLQEWEKFITLLVHFGYLQYSAALDKLFSCYPKYPLECLFEFIEYHSEKRFYDDAVWYEPMVYIYEKYTHKIDKKVFDKYVLMVNKCDDYFISVLSQGNFDIPTKSVFADMDTLLQSRIRYGTQYLTLAEVMAKNTDKIHTFDYENNFLIFKELLEKTILEDEEYKEIQENIIIFNVGYDGEYTFDEFLVHEWGVVKYISHLYQYSDIVQKYEPLYRRFIISLIPKALENHNLRALANIKELIQILDNSIPDNILTNALINRSLWKKEKEFQNIFEEMKASVTKCFDEFTVEAPYTGDIGSVYITFQYKKGFSIWLLLNGYARYEDFNDEIVLYESVLNVYEYGHATRSTYALNCASKVLEKNKIACSVGVWKN